MPRQVRLPGSAVVALHALRAAPALMMVIHGAARAATVNVAPFGEFLGSIGLPAGLAIAWLLTAVEIVGGSALALGFAVRPLCLWFVAEHAVGIATVHAPSGWFVVGLGRNGMEYSVLLLAMFAIIALVDPHWRRMPGDDT